MRPIIAKFSFYKNKELILSNARSLAGTVFGISQDFPREIVEIRRGLVRVLKDAKKEGRDAKLVYDKLYINGLNNDRNDFVTRGSTSLHRKMCFGLPWRPSQTEYVF